MYLNTNLSAIEASQAVQASFQSLQTVEAQLATGSTTTSPGWNPSASTMLAETTGRLGAATQGLANLAQAHDWLRTAGGALQSASQIANNMEQIAIQASSSAVNAQDRTALQRQMDALVQQLRTLSTETTYNQEAVFYNPTLKAPSVSVPENGRFSTPTPVPQQVPLYYWSQLPTFSPNAFASVTLSGDGSNFWLPYTYPNAGLGTFLAQKAFVVPATTTITVNAGADDGMLAYVDSTPAAFSTIDAGAQAALASAGMPLPSSSSTFTIGPGLHTVTIEAYNVAGPAGGNFLVKNAATGATLLSASNTIGHTGWRTTGYFTTPPPGSYASVGSAIIDEVGLSVDGHDGTPDTSRTRWDITTRNTSINSGVHQPSIILPALPQLATLQQTSDYSVSSIAAASTTRALITQLQTTIQSDQTLVGATSVTVQTQHSALVQQVTAEQTSEAAVGGVSLPRAMGVLVRDQLLANLGLRVIADSQQLPQLLAAWMHHQAV